MKTGSNRNTNNAVVYYQNSTQSQSPVTPTEAYVTPEMHSMKSSDKFIKDAETIYQ